MIRLAAGASQLGGADGPFAAVSNGIVTCAFRPPRAAPLVQVGVAVALLAAGAGAYVTRWYAWLPERDDSWKTLSVGQGLLGVAFDPTGTRVAAAGWDYAVTVWDVATGREIHKLRGHTDRIYDVAFTPDGQRIASGSKDSTARFWSTGDGRELAVVTGHRDRVMALAISPDGHTFVTGSRDSTLKLWDADHYRETKSVQPRSGFIAAVAFDPHGRSVLFGAWSGNVKLWRTDSGGTETVVATGPRVRAVAFSSDGRALASASGGLGQGVGLIAVFDATTFKKRATLQEHPRGANAVAFSPDGRTLASAGADGVIVLWDAEQFGQLRRLFGHSDAIFSIAYSPDGRLLASASGDGTVRLWRLVD